MKLLLCCFLFSCALISCQSDQEKNDPVTSYFPSKNQLEKGIVNKYYEYEIQGTDPDTSINLSYRSYQLDGDELKMIYYRDPHSKRNEYLYEIKDDKLKTLSNISINRADEISEAIIIDSTLMNWVDQEAKFKKINKYSWGERILERDQTVKIDTVALGLDAKLFKGALDITTIVENDTTINNYRISNVYAKGLGLVYSEVENKDLKNWSELVEQITLDDFLELSKEPMHKVSHIDTLQAIDRDLPFKICGVHGRIFNYYNDSKSLYYKNGKRAIWNFVNEKLDSEMIQKESGYLTFRFIVNCEGEAGRFVTEQADLDFQPKTFNDNTVNHFYNIVSEMKDWIPTKPWGEYVDAYYYLTFKLDNGQLIEILP